VPKNFRLELQITAATPHILAWASASGGDDPLSVSKQWMGQPQHVRGRTVKRRYARALPSPITGPPKALRALPEGPDLTISVPQQSTCSHRGKQLQPVTRPANQR